MKQKTCEERIDEYHEICKAEWSAALDHFEQEDGPYIDEDGNGYEDLIEYVNNNTLGFDYVEPGTFIDQDEGHWRLQLAWGGPQYEWRFYVSEKLANPHTVLFWFLDWHDGAFRYSPIGERIWDWIEEWRDLE